MRVVVYHADCHDGLAALWVATQSPVWASATPYQGRHADAPDLERLRGADVLIVDFSWRRDQMETIAQVCASLTVLDHHKSAELDLAGFGVDARWHPRAVNVVFDMERSGAGLAWDELVGGERPRMVAYTEDRDLWRFALPSSREIHAALDSYPMTLKVRAGLAHEMEAGSAFERLVNEGAAIMRYRHKLIAGMLKHVGSTEISGYVVPAMVCPAIELISDLAHEMAKDAPFAAVWIDRADGARQYSLRSDANGVDVSVIAAALGGGGHKHAAGFTVRP